MNRRLVAVAAATAFSAGLVTAGIAHARSDDGGSPLGQRLGLLGLTITPLGNVGTTAALSCDPVGGNHPHGEAACADLARVDGRIENIKPRPGQMCPHYVAPVRATAIGRWDSTSINYDHTFNNECLLRRATGTVFAF